MNPSLTLNLLGGVQLLNYDVPLALPKSRKALALFIYLAYTECAHTREALADLLWDTTSTAQSLSNLRTLLTRFPLTMATHLAITRDTIAVHPKDKVLVDACIFTKTMNALPQPLSHTAASTCAGLLANYRGEFLAGFHAPGAPRFDEWLRLERERLHHLALTGYQRLTTYYLECGDYESGIKVVTAMLRLNPTDETGHGHLMRMLAYTGQRTAALAQFEMCRQILQTEVGVEPDATLQELYRQIRDGELATPTVADANIPGPHHNLPAPVTSMLGRQAAVASVQALLRQPDVRLVTLTGPGGVGKSRLGEAVAWTVLDDFADGVFLIELAPVRDPQLFLSAIAQTLAVRDQDSTPLQQRLQEYLRDKQLLLLIDNFEQVIDAAPRVLELLRACPQVKVLVTSREILRLRGEHEFTVPTLALEDAVELFVQRTQAVLPTFRLKPDMASTVATICQQLDYLPLAIELAAAQSKLFSPPAMLERLNDRFAFLVGRTRDLPDRQRTLRTTLDWSYELLTPEEQRLFRCLAVFIGGRSLAAVETVCNPGDDPDVEPLAIAVPDGLTALLDQSLLYQTTDSTGEPRFMMLVTIYDYASAQLADSDEADALRRRHLNYYLTLAEQAETELAGADQIRWLDRLDLELDNLRAALDYALGSGEVELGARLCAALRRFWGMRGHVSEGRQWLSDLLTQAHAIAPLIRAKTLSAAGTLAEAQSDYAQAVTLQQEALALRQAHGDKTGVAVSLNNLGFLAERQGDYRTARSLYEETLALSREIDYKLYIAISLINLGRLHHVLGEYTATRVYAEESLARNRAMDNQWGIALSLDLFGHLLLAAGDYPTARKYYEEALVIRQDFGGKWGIATALRNLGEIHQRQGEYAAARTCYEESLALQKEISDQSGIAGVLNSLGRLHHDLGDNAAAQSLLQQSLALYRSIGETAGTASTHNDLGWVSQSLGDLDAAQTLHEESLSMQRALGQPLQIAIVRHYLATLACRQGDGTRARDYFQESLLIVRDLGEQYWIEQALRAIALLFWQEEKIMVTAQLLSAAEAFRQQLAAPIPPRASAAYGQMLTAVQEGLGEEAFATAWAIGRAMPLEQAVAWALSELEILFRRDD
ncbi:MAG TPA: tetratricopeptide repeat protein [Caldilineaceae bacterium]|nr:tetratricopeptide repeat protein [Caldilineaceae bacterium]